MGCSTTLTLSNFDDYIYMNSDVSTAAFLLLWLLVVELFGADLHWDESAYTHTYISSCLFSIEARAIF